MALFDAETISLCGVQCQDVFDFLFAYELLILTVDNLLSNLVVWFD